MEEIKRAVEALLFAADEPVPLAVLAQGLERQTEDIEKAVSLLQEEYKGRSFRIEAVQGGYMLVTMPQYRGIIRHVLSKKGPSTLSKGAMETLAVMTYRQPVTRQDIEAVRGVNPEASLETLLEKGLVKEAGRKKTLGRPKLYATTPFFLQRVSLNSLQDLPSLPEEGEND